MRVEGFKPAMSARVQHSVYPPGTPEDFWADHDADALCQHPTPGIRDRCREKYGFPRKSVRVAIVSALRNVARFVPFYRASIEAFTIRPSRIVEATTP